MPYNVLLTGGAGFIGSHIAEELLKRNYSVIILDNFSTGNRNNIKSLMNDCRVVEGDIRDYPTVSRVMKDVKIVIHQAALPSVPRSINDPITTNEVNIKGTLNLLWSSVENKVDKFLFASSSSIYGNCSDLIKHEKICPQPLSPYAVTKLAAENYCKVFAETYSLQTICLRYFNVFGPRQDPNSQYSAVIPKFIDLFKNNKQPIIYGDGEQTRDFTFVRNVVKANMLAIENAIDKNLIMNCACNRQVSLNELVKQMNFIFNKNIIPIFQKVRIGDVKHSFADISLAKEKIGYEPDIFFNEGLAETIKSY
ncbi:MAG: SDR family oxidoreductase [Actinobacteria bacterium]|nr:SDR family oxidoreductase [Actinomycetota bacterium]